MAEPGSPALSVATLFAERDAERRLEREQQEQLARRKEEELIAFRKRLDEFELTNDRAEAALHRIRRAFGRGENELMLTSFPSSFCSDDGRAVINAGAPPISQPKPEATRQRTEPDWLPTMPKGVAVVYNYWRQNLQPGGFELSVRVINYPGGMPGDIGLFLSWPKSATDI